MALDFHIAKNESDAPSKQASASFELQSHDLIFYRFGLADNQFPLFKRLKNYYEDAHFYTDELPLLLLELKELKHLFFGNEQLTKQLNGIKSACEDALAEGMQI